MKLNKQLRKHALDMNGEERWNCVFKEASKIKCCGDQTEDGCGTKSPDKIKLEGMATIVAVWEGMKADTEKITMTITPEMALKIFKRISDDDVHFMGFSATWSRPDWMVCQVLAVPPPRSETFCKTRRTAEE